MKKKWSLAALLPGFLTLNTSGASNYPADESKPGTSEIGLKGIVIAPLNVETPLYIAGHRSHSSHSSHRSSSGSSGHSSHSSHSSHRSSAGSGSRSYSPPPSESTSPSSSTPPQTSPSYNSDPLGQPSTPSYTTPSQAELKKQQQIERETLIKRVQLSLSILGYYVGSIDGILGPRTRSAIVRYRWDKGLNRVETIDSELLNSLGIAAP